MFFFFFGSGISSAVRTTTYQHAKPMLGKLRSKTQYVVSPNVMSPVDNSNRDFSAWTSSSSLRENMSPPSHDGEFMVDDSAPSVPSMKELVRGGSFSHAETTPPMERKRIQQRYSMPPEALKDSSHQSGRADQNPSSIWQHSAKASSQQRLSTVFRDLDNLTETMKQGSQQEAEAIKRVLMLAMEKDNACATIGKPNENAELRQVWAKLKEEKRSTNLEKIMRELLPTMASSSPPQTTALDQQSPRTSRVLASSSGESRVSFHVPFFHLATMDESDHSRFFRLEKKKGAVTERVLWLIWPQRVLPDFAQGVRCTQCLDGSDCIIRKSPQKHTERGESHSCHDFFSRWA
jgi:hypothetical protein